MGFVGFFLITVCAELNDLNISTAAIIRQGTN